MNRAADILLCFGQGRPALQLGEIADLCGIPKPTVRRLLISLLSRGLIQQASDGRYELGFRMWELGEVAQSRITLPSAATWVLETLATETGETVVLARADLTALEVTKIDARLPKHALGVKPPDGPRSLIPPGPMGKAILAALSPVELAAAFQTYARRGAEERQLIDAGHIQREAERTRRRGYSVDEQEYVVGVTGVAACIAFGSPRTLAAIAVMAPSERLSGARIARVGARVAELAKELTFSRYREVS